MDKKVLAKKLATAAFIGLVATTSLTGCETLREAGDAAANKNSCKGHGSCKGGGSCKGKGSCNN